jgi:anti-anti-sigma factor
MHMAPGTCSAWVHLAGDVDMAAEDRLGEILNALSTAAARDIYVDLGCVTFAGTALISFLARAGAADILNGPVVLCRTPTSVRHLIEMVGLHRVTVLRDDACPSSLSTHS